MKCATIAFVTLVLASSLAMGFDRAVERAKMLKELEQLPQQQLLLQMDAKTPKAHKKLMQYFRTEMWPTILKLNELGSRAMLLSVARDRALYDSTEEKQAWQSEIQRLESASSEIINSKTTKKITQQFYELSKGLTGDLVNFAQQEWRQIRLGAFQEAQKPRVDRLNKLKLEMEDLSNTSPFVDQIAAAEQQVAQAISKFYSGQLPFDEAWKTIERADARGRSGHGQDLALKGRTVFNEAAILRSELAKTKGYKNWAQFMLANEAHKLRAPYDSVEGLIQFLKLVLEETKAPAEKILATRFKEITGKDLSEARYSQFNLLRPEAENLIRDYLPKEQVETIWQQTLAENGFSPEQIKAIVLDGFPRENKYTHAYMQAVNSRAPKRLVIGGDLNIRAPKSERKFWNDALIYIVQNYTDDGSETFRTAFHEGGHAVDYANRDNFLLADGHASYAETHSITMERFFSDPIFLSAIGKTREGRPLTPELAQQFVDRMNVNKLFEWRTLAARALFDLELWNYDYSTGDQDYMTRSHDLFGASLKESTLLKIESIENLDYAWEAFMRPHFFGGGCDYFGYLLAEMAAESTAQKLWDTFEQKTGRRSFYRQPDFARMLIDGYYRNGFEEPFPVRTEQFTGQSFEPRTQVKPVVAAVENFLRASNGAPVICTGVMSTAKNEGTP